MVEGEWFSPGEVAPSLPSELDTDEVLDYPTEAELKILKDPELLTIIIKEVQDEGVVGEDKSIAILVCKTELTNVIGVSPTSNNLVISDDSGGGKDAITKATLKVLVPKHRLIHVTHMSAHAFEYYAEKKDKNWSWDDKVFYLEDPEEEVLQSQAFRVMASGGCEAFTVHNQQIKLLELRGKPTMVVTSMRANIDKEGERRWDAMRIDTSSDLTQKVKERKAKKAQGTLPLCRDDIVSKTIQKWIQRREVVIRYAERIPKYLPDTLVMRTQIDKFFDYIKASAVLHQYQRESDENGRLIATGEDYEYAKFVFTELKDDKGKPMSKDEEDFLKTVALAGRPISIKEASKIYRKHSIKWIYDHFDNWKERGLIKEGSDFNQQANRDVTVFEATIDFKDIKLPDFKDL